MAQPSDSDQQYLIVAGCLVPFANRERYSPPREDARFLRAKGAAAIARHCR